MENKTLGELIRLQETNPNAKKIKTTIMTTTKLYNFIKRNDVPQSIVFYGTEQRNLDSMTEENSCWWEFLLFVQFSELKEFVKVLGREAFKDLSLPAKITPDFVVFDLMKVNHGSNFDLKKLVKMLKL